MDMECKETDKVTIEEARKQQGMSRREVSEWLEIPYRTLTNWENGVRSCPHYIEKLPIGTYTLREEQAPDGYLVAEDITFEVKDTAEIQKVVMKDEAKPTDVPKTGDDTNLWLPLLLMVLSAAGLTGLAVSRRRKKRKNG